MKVCCNISLLFHIIISVHTYIIYHLIENATHAVSPLDGLMIEFMAMLDADTLLHFGISEIDDVSEHLRRGSGKRWCETLPSLRTQHVSSNGYNDRTYCEVDFDQMSYLLEGRDGGGKQLQDIDQMRLLAKKIVYKSRRRR
jgi:hypothetical protein